MPLIDLLACEGVHDAPPSSYCSLFRVLLFNIVAGLECGHIEDGPTRDIFIELLNALEPIADDRPLHIDWVYVEMTAILTRWDPAKLFNRRERIVSHLAAQPMSCQPSWRLKDWLRDVPEVRNEVHSAGDVEVGLREFMNEENRVPDAKVGDPVVWLTPYSGAVAELIDAAKQDYVDTGISGLDRMDYAQRLRDLLGIQRRIHPDRTIAIVFHNTIGKLQSAAVKDLDATHGGAARPRLAAPTQFDAGDYPRFRHWPTSDAADERDYGRTWDLGNEAASDAACGVPELVSDPISLDKARLLPLGQIRTYAPSEAEAIKLDLAFADGVCGPNTIESLIPLLADRLRV